MRHFLITALLFALVIPCLARGRSSSSRSASRSSKSYSTRSKSTYCTSCKRGADGRIVRDRSARRRFQQQNPCPSTGKTSGACPGYVVDHIKPLKRGGPDEPSNMQWQTKAQAKAKDRVE